MSEETEQPKPPNPHVYPEQAFQHLDGRIIGPDAYGFDRGLTLRDHFAGLAMQAIVANEGVGDLGYLGKGKDAARAYELADAMLEARGNG